jgi:hypothetical protein
MTDAAQERMNQTLAARVADGERAKNLLREFLTENDPKLLRLMDRMRQKFGAKLISGSILRQGAWVDMRLLGRNET